MDAVPIRRAGRSPVKVMQVATIGVLQDEIERVVLGERSVKSHNIFGFLSSRVERCQSLGLVPVLLSKPLVSVTLENVDPAVGVGGLLPLRKWSATIASCLCS